MANKNIELMRGNPETAVRKLAIPVMISMLLTASYNIIDGIWITGLGEAAIAGIGFVTPIFMILNGVSVGLGSGATSSISRFVGAHDKNRASDSAAHSIIILFITSIILTLIFLVIQEPLLRIYGASGTALEEALSYSTPLFLGLIGIMFANGASGILRGEGDMKRAMYAVVVSVILNAILDPIFIYTFGLGAAGAAIATVLSSLISAIVILYWLLVKKDTYVDINLRKFKFNSKITKNILKVGIPASLDMFIMSIAVALYLIFITIISGDYGVAAYTSGQRIYLFAIMPLTAIGTAVVAVCGSAFGAENGDYLSRAHKYGAKFGILFGLAVTIIVVLFATPIASIFAYTPETSHLVSGIALFLQFAFLSIPLTGAGMASSFLYQGIGRGVTSLFFTIFREVICTVILTYLFGIVLEWGLIGIWIGLAVGRSIASIVNYIYGRHTIKQIRTKLGT
ncbi:multidrug export protein MepA [Methanobrevibacter woesei]|uniref:Multidrug export protein MepA n=1 Tax=Methanobrevibacter woesei TaxID=190976 RepID=A0A2U1S8J7_9EURY|nr:MATE family efflux transporter [Methanobrevibacter woesei]PWB86595.1 multidrug export protein MepA [Methanobrevibacter woesei]